MDYFPKDDKENLKIFWVETDKIRPNPFQPRHEFDEQKLRELSESIRQYGVLQPMVVVRCEREVPTGTEVDYELIAGERRLRASKMAGLTQVPVIIRREPPEKIKLELALIENVQREDLNPIERAKAFKQLMTEFNLMQKEVGSRVGKSREFVANSLRLLGLPQEYQNAIVEGRIYEGHARPLLMLSDRPEAQQALFNDIINRKLSVRDAEKYSRRIAVERARKQDDLPDRQTHALEERLAQVLGTRVTIERKGLGGVVAISFFSDEELQKIMESIAHERAQEAMTAERGESAPSMDEGSFKQDIPEQNVIPEETAPEVLLASVDLLARDLDGAEGAEREDGFGADDENVANTENKEFKKDETNPDFLDGFTV